MLNRNEIFSQAEKKRIEECVNRTTTELGKQIGNDPLRAYILLTYARGLTIQQFDLDTPNDNEKSLIDSFQTEINNVKEENSHFGHETSLFIRNCIDTTILNIFNSAEFQGYLTSRMNRIVKRGGKSPMIGEVEDVHLAA